MNSVAQRLLSGEDLAEEIPTFRSEPLTESGLRKRLRESEGELILTEEEVQMLVQMLESDPFRNGPTFDKGDLDNLGLDVKGGNDSVRDIATGDGQDPVQSTNVLPDGIINVDQAVVAPNATPGHDEPVPDSVLHATEIISGQEKPVPEGMYSEEEPSATTEPPESPLAADTPAVDDVAARLVNGGEEEVAESIPFNANAHDPGLDPNSLRETMRKLRGGKAPTQNNSAKRMNLEEIARRSGGGEELSEAHQQASAKISAL